MHKKNNTGDTSIDRSLVFNTSAMEVDTQELDFYESLLQRHRQTTSQSLLNKRATIAKEDPTEEIIELHLEI